jgi:hypothetical protein
MLVEIIGAGVPLAENRKSTVGASDGLSLLETHRAILLNAATAWIHDGMRDEERIKLANRRILATLTQHLGPLDEFEGGNLPLAPALALEAEVISGFMSIFMMLHSIRECEFYFRRYPFGDTKISRSDYLRNCCEMLFDRIAQMKDRLKLSLNSIQRAVPTKALPVGKIIKLFSRAFAGPLKLRNHVHHHDRYSDDDISQLSLLNLLEEAEHLNLSSNAPEPPRASLRPLLNQKILYQRAARKWISRIDQYEKSAEIFVELVSQLIIDQCDFIRQHMSDADVQRLAKCKRHEF